ncbi:uncharacterized protein NEMAJ01_1258 [Nematocida major]|uniref:uncharacterized protein n=1 Tax=Nematocida major TaxID=1912982 RepID=UPI00200821DE|nr:uncharacterized protein NEMAJ01_1258 [Nematocida major]KAH9386362.1 hypothetical protein NEMAJ01_1258 [Nematocida major]
MKTMRVSSMLLAALCGAASVACSSTCQTMFQDSDSSSEEFSSNESEDLFALLMKRSIPSTVIQSEVAAVKNPALPKITQKLSESINKAMEFIKEMIEEKTYISSKSKKLTDPTQSIDLCGIYAYFNTLQLSCISSRQKTALLKACIEFDFKKIDAALKSMYISLVNHEYLVDVSSAITTSNKKSIVSETSTRLPFFQISETHTKNTFAYRLLEIQTTSEKSIIDSACDFFKQQKKAELKESFRTIFLATNVEGPLPKTETSSANPGVGVCSKNTTISSQRKKQQVMPITVAKNSEMKVKSIFSPVQENTCEFEEWKDFVLQNASNASKKLTRIPWSYLDSRVFACTDLKLDVSLLKMIISSVLGLEMKNEINAHRPTLQRHLTALSPIMHALIEKILAIIDKHAEVLEKTHATTLWMKGRIYNIVFNYIRGELTPSLLNYYLGQISEEVAEALKKLNIADEASDVYVILKKHTVTVREIVALQKTAEPGETWTGLKSELPALPYILQNLLLKSQKV